MKAPINLKRLLVLLVFSFFHASLSAKPMLWKGASVLTGEKLLAGELTIVLKNGKVTGNIGGLSAQDTLDGQQRFTLSFTPKNTKTLNAGSGYFRGYVTNKNELRGHWVRYGMQVRASYPYATPVHFSQKGNTYQARVNPFEDKLTIFFKGAPLKNGRHALTVFIPETNNGRFARDNQLLLADGKAQVFRRSNGKERLYAQGKYNPSTNSYTLGYESWGGDIYFEAQPDDPRGLLGKQQKLPYQQPVNENDGWPVGHADEFGISSDALQNFANMLNANPAQKTSDAQTEAFLLARNGVLIYENYFRGYDPETPHDLRSASKSLTGILPGLIEQAAKKNQINLASQNSPVSLLDERIYEVLGLETDDPRKQNLTLEHSLSMSTGLDCDDNDQDSPGNENTMQYQQEQPDWFRYILELDAKHQPGSHLAYCSGGINLAGAVLSAKTNLWLPTLIDDLFARPLGIKDYHINLQPDGQQAYSGGGLYLRARDFLKLGQLMLNKGRWNNQQLLSPEYVDNVLTARGSMFSDKYGLGWWMRTYKIGEREYEVFYAGGNGGQQILAVPELDMVAVFLGSAYGTRGTFKVRDDWFPNFILSKAIKEQTSNSGKSI